MTKKPFRLTPYQVQFLIVVGFASVGYALYLRYLGIENSQVGLACDAGLPENNPGSQAGKSPPVMSPSRLARGVVDRLRG